ncbi:hypothetical protein [Burkholderia glumae]|uniref:hypothetical protein n=1 Tax=Burkholderia glumae TaxID=337 RepID=UPI000F5D8F46|nr:hypothetical protein [Burkholderia glumae]
MIPQAQVASMFREVQLGLAEHLKSSLSEVFFPKANHPDILENGTGSFVDVNGVKLLVSNEHVIKSEGLHHSFPNHDRYVSGAYQKHVVAEPVDVGVSRIKDDAWSAYGSGALAIPLSRFALRHDTHPHEILWTAGYPGARVKQLAATYAVAQVLSTQEHIFREGEALHESFDPKYHFGVAYSPENAQRIDEDAVSNSPGLSDPHGLSGSLVWNSRRLECFYNGQPWDPSMSLVTGIIWGWPSSNYLIATKVEHFRDFFAIASQLPSTPSA